MKEWWDAAFRLGNHLRDQQHIGVLVKTIFKSESLVWNPETVRFVFLRLTRHL